MIQRIPCSVSGCHRYADHGWRQCSDHRARSGLPNQDQLARARQLMREGHSLGTAAARVGCLAGALDLALWTTIGRRFRRPQF